MSQVQVFNSEDGSSEAGVEGEEDVSSEGDEIIEESKVEEVIEDEGPSAAPPDVEEVGRVEEEVGEGTEVEEQEQIQVLEVSAETVGGDSPQMSNKMVSTEEVKTVVVKKSRDQKILVSDKREEESTSTEHLVEEVLGAVGGYISESDREQRQERLIKETKAQARGEADKGSEEGGSGNYFWE